MSLLPLEELAIDMLHIIINNNYNKFVLQKSPYLVYITGGSFFPSNFCLCYVCCSCFLCIFVWWVQYFLLFCQSIVHFNHYSFQKDLVLCMHSVFLKLLHLSPFVHMCHYCGDAVTKRSTKWFGGQKHNGVACVIKFCEETIYLSISLVGLLRSQAYLLQLLLYKP